MTGDKQLLKPGRCEASNGASEQQAQLHLTHNHSDPLRTWQRMTTIKDYRNTSSSDHNTSVSQTGNISMSFKKEKSVLTADL